MDVEEMGIILAIVGLGFTIIGTLGNNKFNKLSTQIEGVEIKLKGELSRIYDEIRLLREQNANNTTNANNANKDVKDKIDKLEEHVRYSLEDRIRVILETFLPKKGR